jgi:class 3 adenylate cyclase
VQPGIVALRGALTAAWEEDLRAVRQDRFNTGSGKPALAFIERFYALISELRAPIQRAWGPGGLVHVADSSAVGGPGPRVSQTRLKLRNRGELVSVHASSYVDGSPKAHPSLGLDREIQVVDVPAIGLVQETYRLAVDFLQVALNVDLSLHGSGWLYDQVAANHFVGVGQWPAVGEVYQRASREFALEESFERVADMFHPIVATAGANGSNGMGHANGDAQALAAQEAVLTLERLQRCRDTQGELDRFMQGLRLVVAADPDTRRVTSDEATRELGLTHVDVRKLGRLLAGAADVCRDGEFTTDFSEWSFLPSYNVHFFRRVNTIDDYLVIASTLVPRAAGEGTTTTSPGTGFRVDPGSSLPDGIVTFLMTDVVESTPLWLQSRAQMYAAMRRHDQLLTSSIEGNGGIVLKERGEGDSFFAVFLRATDAVVAALEAQRAIQSEPWPDRLELSVRMAILTGEADAADRDYRSPAVNRCAKLRRRAVGNQVLVSETTYSIVADILREDIRLVGVGKRRLEGHDRTEEVYVLQHPEVRLEAEVESDEVLA